MESANTHPEPRFLQAVSELAEEYGLDPVLAAYAEHQEELDACPSPQAAYKLLAKYVADAGPPTPNPLQRIAQGDAAALAELNAQATPRPLPERERADRECIPCKPEPWERPRPPRKNAPPEYRTPGASGRRETPWDLFRMAGFSPLLLTPSERAIVRTVYWAHSLGKGWGLRDRATPNAAGIPLLPAKLARYHGTTRRSVKRSIERLLACGLLRVVERVSGYPSLYAAGWWHGRDAEEQNLAALRRSLDLLPRRHPPRSGGCGKPRRKVASVPSSVPSPVPSSVPSSVPSPVPTPLGTDETGNPPEAKEIADPKCTLASGIRESGNQGIRESGNQGRKESLKRTPSAGMATPSHEDEDAPREDDEAVPTIPWEELRKLIRPMLAGTPTKGGDNP